jgi:predicted acylesterase/phospholipase RssA
MSEHEGGVGMGGGVRAHLVLSAGGVKCVSYVGALAVLAERGISFASVSACSAGSLVGALLCAGKTPREIEADFYRTELSQFKGQGGGWWPPRSFFSWPYSLRGEPGVPEMFRRFVGHDPTFGELYDKSQVPFALAGVDIVSGRLLVYSAEAHADMPVSEALKIATSVPFLNPPYEPAGRIVVDAAFASQCPVWLAAEYEEELPIVALQPKKPRLLSHPKRPWQYLARLMDAGIGSRDFYQTGQFPRLRMITIDCGDVQATQTSLGRKEKEFLVVSGRDAAVTALAQYGDDLRTPPPPPTLSALTGSDARAEAVAGRLMRRFNRAAPGPRRDRVFISYAHKDEPKWFEMFRDELRRRLPEGGAGLWHDRLIEAGDEWDDEIMEALHKTRVALMLVTPKYMESAFISTRELKHFVKAAESGGLRVMWVPVSYTPTLNTPLASFQSPHPGGMDSPLDRLGPADQEEAVRKICLAVRRAVVG